MRRISIGAVLLVCAIVLGLLVTAYARGGWSFEHTTEQSKGIVVYETEVDSKEDCSSKETYDAARHVCILTCSSQEVCDATYAEISNEYDAWTQELKQSPTGVKESKNASTDVGIKALYTVSPGEHISLAEGTDSVGYQQLWSEIAALSPDWLSDSTIKKFEVFDNPKDDTLAYVDNEDGAGSWLIAVNVSGQKESSPREQKATLIHEISHLISLRAPQVEVVGAACKTLKLDDGCAAGNSYIYAFWKEFWQGKTNQRFSDDAFVTEYAASSMEEDFAESFTFFVLTNSKDATGTLKGSKINFFYQYPDLVAIRNAMRSSLSSDILRASK